MRVSPAILAHVDLPYGAVELVEWRWPAPLDVIVCEDRHMIEMSLPPHATEGVAAFPDMAPDQFHYMGSMFVRPAGVRLRARSPGGRIRVVRLAIDSAATTPGAQLLLSEAAPTCGLDLRDKAPRMLLGRIRDELVRPGSASTQLLRAYSDALLIETLRSIETRTRRTDGRGRLSGWQYQRVAERIDAAGPPPGLAELAQLSGVSTRHFTRLYRVLTGESAAQTITRTRLRRAAALLGEGHAPIKAIATELGFADAAGFSTAFRREAGISPNRYRQRVTARARTE